MEIQPEFKPQVVTLIVAASDSLHPERADYYCDGTDDDVQIQAAIDALPANGGKVLLLEGIYNLTGVNYTTNILTTTNSNIVIEGQGKSTHIKIVTNESKYIIYFDGVQNCVVKDLFIDGNGGLGGYAIVFNDSSECKVLNCACGDTWADGIIGTNLSYSIIENNKIYDCNRSSHGDTSSGIELEDGCNHVIVNHNYISNCNKGIWAKRHSAAALTHDIIISKNILYNSEINLSSEDTNPIEDINVVGNILSGATTCLPIVLTNVINSTISDNILNSPVHTYGGIYLPTTTNHIIVTGNKIYSASSAGVYGYGSSHIISNNYISNPVGNGITGFYPDGIISNNIVEGSSARGIYVGSNNITVIENIVKNSAQAGIRVFNTNDVTLIGNVCFDDQGVKTQTYGIEISQWSGTCDYITAIGNTLRGNLTGGLIEDVGDGTIINAHGNIKNKYSDLLMDVLAVSATHIRSNEDLSAATPITFTLDAQPDIPRTLSWSFDSHAQITEYDMEVIGVDAKGNSVTETWDETAGWSGETSNAFATITSIKMTSRTGTGVADTMDIGITDVIGLSNTIYATSDVFKIKKNNVNATVATAQVNTIYDTYDMSVIGLNVGDDFTIWYKSNLNIIS